MSLTPTRNGEGAGAGAGTGSANSNSAGLVHNPSKAMKAWRLTEDSDGSANGNTANDNGSNDFDINASQPLINIDPTIDPTIK